MTTPTVQEIRNSQKADGSATILAIGTANPSTEICQTEYPDFYFRVTKSEHMTEVKKKFKRICENSSIKKRHMHITEEFLKENPNMCDINATSLDTRQEILATEVPKLGQEAAVKAIKEWGQPQSKITHVIFCTSSGVHMPGADYKLTKLLGLQPSVKRFMLYQQACSGGGNAIRLAKDLAENNRGARVLAVCVEISVISFQGPNDTNFNDMVSQALLGDGAGAVIVGADPVESIERPIFQLVWASQTILPDSEGSIVGHLREVGLCYNLLEDIPNLLSRNIENVLVEAFNPIGINDWNSIFWVNHPGGPAILNQLEASLGLNQDKLSASRHVLGEYGNMSSATVLFVMDEIRMRSMKEKMPTTGGGLDWGVLFGFGPGFTIETVVLHSVPLAS